MPKIVSAHQPNFLPYLGFFDKMKKSDIFVIRDEVLFVKKDYHNRNQIRINSYNNINNPQSKWIKVPVNNKNKYIMHIQIKKDAMIKKIPWNIKLLQEIKASYEGSNFFYKYYPKLKEILDNSDNNLIELNMKIINFLKESFKINTEIIRASELNIKPSNYNKNNFTDASEDLALICKSLKANVYLSGTGGKKYLNLKPFKEKKIKVKFQKFDHPVYKQKYPKFLPYMSAIDALFCIGKFPE